MMSFYRFVYFYVLVAFQTLVSSSRLAGIPTVPFDTAAGGGTYPLTSIKSIVVDAAYANHTDDSGETTIPPTLNDFATTFAADLFIIWDFDNISVTVGAEPQDNSVFLTLSENSTYQYASGETSAEAYELEVTASGITVRGASPLGVFWGTRSILQLFILGEGEVPLGKGVDAPGWKVRGMMLDVARHYYPLEFIGGICAYMSFFKQNTLQLHLSDNLYNNAKLYSREQSLSLYARFRLWSDAPEVEGLNQYQNESYIRHDFQGLQKLCADRGVTIIPEIEAPGHALPICKTVHIGADEYTGDVKEYNDFVNAMADFIQTNGSKSVRIWGTFPPKPEYDNNISNNVSVQHWAFFEDNPLTEYLHNNYSVVNSDDTFYVVNKWSGSYPQKLNIAATFAGDPSSGGPWQPYIFDTKNSTNNPSSAGSDEARRILGSIAPLWNDYGPNATVYSEAFYAWREGLPALADKQWGGTLLREEFVAVFPALLPLVPGQGLERRIASRGGEILRYDADSWAHARDFAPNDTWTVADRSGNGYDAMTNCAVSDNNTIAFDSQCSLRTVLLSKGRDYTLTLRLYMYHVAADGGAAVMAGPDSVLMLTPEITLFSAGTYYRLNATVPLYTWFDLSITARGERTYASVREVRLGDAFVAEPDHEFQAVLGVNGESRVWAPVAVEAPLSEIVGSNDHWTGEFGGMRLTDGTV
ncbi:beta-hexosaminidase [Astrocystis sublimbata]|nr:beta-hexosaminidase [Astrocystis sublimbata]